MLTFEDAAIKMLIEEHRRALNAIKIPNGWGCGPIVDNFSGLQGAFFWLLGKQDRTPGGYPRDPGDGTSGATNESFHPMVRIRTDKVKGYRPASLKGYSLEYSDERARWQWAKKTGQAVPEWVMSPEKTMSLAYEEDGVVKFRDESCLSRVLCPKSILMNLDRLNGMNTLKAMNGHEKK